MILVTGAGGKVGSEVVKQLRQAGAPFRAAFHTPSKAEAARAAGIEAVRIDYDQPDTLPRALQDVDTLFLLGNGDGQARKEIAMVEAAKQARVQRIVKLSVIAADTESYSFARLHRAVEKAIEASGLSWTHLRPNGFMQNLGNQMIGTIREQGAFYSSTGDAKITHVDVRDIAAVAARVLTESGHEGKSYTLTGPAPLSYDEIAGKLSAAGGREIRFVNLPDADLKQGLLGAGAPEPFADAFLDLLRFYRTGDASIVSDDIRRVTGSDARTFDDYARDHAPLFA